MYNTISLPFSLLLQTYYDLFPSLFSLSLPPMSAPVRASDSPKHPIVSPFRNWAQKYSAILVPLSSPYVVVFVVFGRGSIVISSAHYSESGRSGMGLSSSSPPTSLHSPDK